MEVENAISRRDALLLHGSLPVAQHHVLEHLVDLQVQFGRSLDMVFNDQWRLLREVSYES
ncbi:Protein of unknown function [Gryllus bimaculatus]|nr:Protein of unknown function [Gryllus bimaculatus]